jgi:hypothetical protein
MEGDMGMPARAHGIGTLVHLQVKAHKYYGPKIGGEGLNIRIRKLLCKTAIVNEFVSNPTRTPRPGHL